MANAIKVEKRGHVLAVTIDRPKANAIDLAASRVMGKISLIFPMTQICVWRF